MVKVRTALLEHGEMEMEQPERTKKLRQVWRKHICAAIRGQEQAEQSLRRGGTPFKIPRFCEMSAAQWRAVEGPMHLRWLAKAYGLLGPVLPYEAEASRHLELRFGGLVARRGNFLLHSEEMLHPEIQVRECAPLKQYSLFLIDADYPNESSRRREQYCLWAK